jgi:hypothetical protein
MDGVVIKPGGVGGDNDVVGLLCYIVLCLLHLLLLLWGKLDKNIRATTCKVPVRYWQCCGSGMFIPDPGSEFFSFWIQGQKVSRMAGSRTWICIRIKDLKYIIPKNCFYALEYMIQNVHPGYGSWIRILILFFVLKFLPSLIFKHKKAAFPQLRDLATNKGRNKPAGFGSGSIDKRYESADSDPYQNVYPQHCGSGSGFATLPLCLMPFV